ncbi:MAG TPA: oligopeptide/dipeptide ABC transporter ATP-binding protein [Methanomassiliicoccales archaeon]|nr:oligopeptide/dipeptide ABC transporter ATP-binding protein [Methanomassiliicoccales archaeon]
MTDALIETRGLKKHFPIRGGLLKKTKGAVRAVDGIDIHINRGETLGLVGESGCGKTTAGRCMLMLTSPTAGRVYYKMPGEVRERVIELEDEIAKVDPEGTGDVPDKIADEYDDIGEKYALNMKDPEELRKLRREMQIVFQDPFSSLNPRMLIRDIIGEPMLVHGVAQGEELRERVTALMEKVGLNPEHLYRYPHEFSGGQRQRIGVARALALNPDMVVLDEPTSALDVSVQAQILNMLNDLQAEFGLTFMFISHDLSTIRYMCDRVAVMYLGKVVESAPKEELFRRPLHPYTEALISVIPIPDPELRRDRIVLSGDVPSPAKPPSGCRFHTRCRYREEICEKVEPLLADKGGQHFVACHFR